MLDLYEKLKQVHCGASSGSMLSESLLARLPITVQRYVQRTHAVGAPIPETFEVEFTGEMKVKADGPWLPIRAWQFTNVQKRVRLFYIEAKMFGVPLRGLHVYRNGTATMKIKLAGLITVADAFGPIMDKSETVTFLNDLCLIAPEQLVDPAITWTPVDDHTVDASFTVNDNTVSARLFFNADGDLIDFASDDRSMSSDGKTHIQARWTTPASRYAVLNGRRLPTYGEAYWHLPSGLFCYAHFNVTRR